MDFDLDDILGEPTIQRSEVHIEDDFSNDDFSSLEFEEITEEVEEIEIPEEVEKPYTEAEAKENATMLIDLIDTVNTATLTPLARWKLRKKRGGKDAIRKMQLVQEKQFTEKELTEAEKRLLFQYQAYLKDKEELEKAIPYTEDEREQLIRSATHYLKGKKIRISGDLSFWGELAMIQGSRLMQILTA